MKNIKKALKYLETWKKKDLENYTKRELQVPIFLNGELVYDNPTAKEKREFTNEQFKTLYPEITRLTNPHEYYVDLTIKLLKLKKQLINNAKKNNGGRQKTYAIEKK